MSALIQIPQERRVIGQFNSRRGSAPLKWAAEKQFLVAHFQRNKDLLECEPESLGDVILQAAGIGLSLNPALGYVYPVPYRDGGVKRAQALIGYRGLLAMAAQADTVRNIQANLVREKDPVFRVWTDTSGRQIAHEENRGARGEVTHAYCIAWFPGGGHHVEVMTAQELGACEKAASARNQAGGAVWRGPFRSQMQIKAVIRRAWKFWPRDAGGRLERAIAAMDELEPLDPGPAVCITDEDALRLHAMCTDAGLSSAEADAWLDRLAKRYGLAEIKNLPAADLERAARELKAYLGMRHGNN